MAGEKAPKPISPTEAAKKLRGLSQQILSYFDGSMSGDSTTTMFASQSRIRLRNAKERRQFADQYEVSRSQLWNKLDVVISARRPSEIRAAIKYIQENIRVELEYIQSERKLLYQIAEEAALLSSSSGGVSAGSPYMAKVAREMMDLIQSLPTQDDLPKPGYETTVRSIVAILRNAQVPGATKIDMTTLAGKDVNGNGSEESNDTGDSEGGVAAAAAEISVSAP